MNPVTVQVDRVVVTTEERAILDNVSLHVSAGERIAIVGSNGAGKSTLLKLLTGMVHAERGTVRVLEHDLSQPMSRHESRQFRGCVGLVFQGLHLVQRLTALENVLLGSLSRNRSWLAWARIFPRSEVRRAEAALEKVGLIGKAGVRSDRLSGGERQKTAIARMLMQDAQLILADEPTAALDPAASLDIAHILSSLAQENHASLITVVHDPGLLPLLADRVIGLRQGRIIFNLPVSEVDDQALNGLYRDMASKGWMTRFHQSASAVAQGESA